MFPQEKKKRKKGEPGTIQGETKKYEAPSKYQGVNLRRCPQMVNFSMWCLSLKRGGFVRLGSLTEQPHAKILCEDISKSVGNKRTSAEPLFSLLVKQLVGQGVMKRGRNNSKVAVSECQVCNRTGPPAQSMQDSWGSWRTTSFIKPPTYTTS